MFCLASQSNNAVASLCTLSGMICNVPPASKDENISYTDTSKLMLVHVQQLSPAEIACRWPKSARRLRIPLWVQQTPLGRPVEPEVYMIYIKDVGLFGGFSVFLVAMRGQSRSRHTHVVLRLPAGQLASRRS